ncbi:MAG: extensin family protein [Sphingosinicella sp.]|nr:extensin family protein [Sphingosinicella sp.]
MRLVRVLKVLLLAGLASFGAVLLYGYARSHPQDLPWTRLDLTQKPGAFTGRKLAGLAGDSGQCRILLARAGIQFTPAPPLKASEQCGYDDAIRFRPAGAVSIGYRPADLTIACPVGAALALWEWHVVQPAALRHFGQRVAQIDHFGSYSCRRLYGRSQGDWSEHSRANAVDVAGFRLEDGRRINILKDWEWDGARSAFLKEVRDGACGLFATVLSPDYNQAHRDHFHLDQAPRGETGWRACR